MDARPRGRAAQACRELGITLVPYSPLGRGFLTGQIRTPADFAEDDFRRNNPRFQGENFQKNLALVEKVGALARQKGCTPGQLALAWVMAQGDDVVPIPGTKRRKYLEENLGAARGPAHPRRTWRTSRRSSRGERSRGRGTRRARWGSARRTRSAGRADALRCVLTGRGAVTSSARPEVVPCSPTLR